MLSYLILTYDLSRPIKLWLISAASYALQFIYVKYGNFLFYRDVVDLFYIFHLLRKFGFLLIWLFFHINFSFINSAVFRVKIAFFFISVLFAYPVLDITRFIVNIRRAYPEIQKAYSEIRKAFSDVRRAFSDVRRAYYRETETDMERPTKSSENVTQMLTNLNLESTDNNPPNGQTSTFNSVSQFVLDHTYNLALERFGNAKKPHSS